MSRVILFILLVFNSFAIFSQTDIGEIRFIPCSPSVYEIPFTKNWANIMEVDVKINGVLKTFHFDTGATLIAFGNEFYDYLYSNSLIKDEDIIGKRTSLMGNGNEVEVILVNIKKVTIGDLTLTNIQAVVFQQADAPFLLGQNVFSKFNNITIDNNNNKIVLQKSNEIDNLKKIIDGNSFSVLKYTEETKVIPQKAIDNLTDSTITIRYFHPDDEVKANEINQILIENNYSAKTQNMLNKISTTIPNYIEIWIK